MLGKIIWLGYYDNETVWDDAHMERVQVRSNYYFNKLICDIELNKTQGLTYLSVHE